MSKADKTRSFIVEKTAPIFNVKGYAGTSLSDIMQATGLTKGSIYGNFENKDEVALAAFDYNLSQVQNCISTAIAKQGSTRDKLMVYVKVYQKFLKEPFPEGGCPILNTATEADDTHPLLKQKAANAMDAWKNRLIGLLEAGIQSDELRKDIQPEQTALTIICLIEGGVMVSKLTGKINYLKLVMQSLEKYINELIAA